MIARLEAGDAGADLGHHPGPFVAQDRRKQAFRILAGQREGIGMADAGRLDLDQNLTRLRPLELYGFDAEWLPGFQGNGGTNSHGVVTIAGPEDKVAYELPNGSSFASPAELKARLLEDYRGQITDNAIKRVLAYALGREIMPLDRPAIKEIQSAIEENHHRLSALIEVVALSYPFRHKEN